MQTLPKTPLPETLVKGQYTALLSEAILVLSKICPLCKLSFFVLGVVRIAVCRTDPLEFEQNVKERLEIDLCVLSYRSLA